MQKFLISAAIALCSLPLFAQTDENNDDPINLKEVIVTATYNPQNEMYTFAKRNVHFLNGG